jgi:predicted DNA-binding protein YlxM (UPF0122 family)
MIDKISEMSLHLDFYGSLLTEKQKQVMGYYFEEDMSLGEISEELHTSRQAVYDLIKRSEKILRKYEAELGLINRFVAQKEKLIEIKKILINYHSHDDLNRAINLVNEIIEM